MAQVYAIASATAVKIGFSEEPARRVVELQTKKTGPLEIKVTRSVDDARAVERVAHFLLAEQRLSGEWFDVDVETAIAAIDSAISMVDGGFRAPQKDDLLHLRIHPDLKAAVVATASAQGETLTSLVEKLLTDYCKKNGFLKEQK